jgi:hypothetical protein
MKLRIVIFAISLASILSLISTASAWEITSQGENAIGDRQFIAFEEDTLNSGTFNSLGIACTESLFEIKVASEERFSSSRKARIRYDSKTATTWSIKLGPTDSNGFLQAVEFQNPKTIYKNLLSSKTFVVQLTTQNGGLYSMKFKVANTSKLSAGLRAAGCKI